MPRKPTKATGGSMARSSSKRAAPEKATPTRQSKRTKSTPAETSYVELDSDDGNDNQPEDQGKSEASDYEEPEDKESESESEPDAAESDDISQKKGTSRGRPAKQTVLPVHKKGANEQELWKTGAKLEPGTQIIIKKPKARDAGDTPYTDETIHPNTMLFLKDLAANNDRQWLKLHDPDYRMGLQDFTTFLEKLTEKVIEVDETIPDLPVKDIIFRIYRDVRFSKDQTPYKTHFSAAFSRTGRKGPYAAYYVQVKPGGSFVGGGLWQPEAQPLALLRRDIDRKPHKIKRVLTDARLRKDYFGGIGNDAKKAVKAFTNQSENKSTALKKHPKGYDNDHRDIELLRLRSFTVGRKLSDSEVVGVQGLDRITSLIASMLPFVTYLNSVVQPDEESSESEDEGNESNRNSGDEVENESVGGVDG
ncbi:hypothetical protein B0J11DRAFT_104754 [Dendryphion nanum]|uniref:DUF2461 domain-containing protein n=1 Tax=Dendryphion nanum TaxID=256645 RepID=A0A9P9DDH7_9PLEO|nr:hypothetical protein B0J11DRAFT_104754 [Dendryphion nanum]